MLGFRFLRETVIMFGWASHLSHRDLRFLLSLRSARLIAAALVLSALFPQASFAITINMAYYNEGDPVPHDENPSWDPDGTILKAHFQTAKSIWESLLPGSGTYDLTFEWDNDIGANTLGLTTPGPNPQTLNNLVEINPTRPWFADPTPATSEEFSSISSSVYSGLSASDRMTYFTSAAPPDNLEVRAVRLGNAGAVGAGGYDAESGYDLLSTIVHELGHVLGVNIEPGDFNIDPLHIGGVQDVTVLENNGHLGGDSASPGFLMCDSCGTVGRRRIPTATDVLVIAEDQGISDVHLARVDRISAGNWNNTNAWIGADVPDATQDVYVRSAAAVTLDVNASVKSLDVRGGSTVDAAGFQLAAAGDLRFDGGAISVAAGGSISADAIHGNPANLTTAAGSSIQFNNFTRGASLATAATFNGNVAIGVGSSTSLLTFNPDNSIATWNVGQNLTIGNPQLPTKLVIDNGAWSVGGNLSIPAGGEVLVDGGTLGLTGSASIGGSLTYKSHNASNTTYTLFGGSAMKKTTPPPTHLLISSAGQMTFESTSPAAPVTAASATINVGGGTGDGGPGAVVTFKGNSGADHAQFWSMAGIGGDSLRISNPVVIAGTGGRVIFEDDSKANLAHFRNDGVAAHGPSDSGGSTYFRNNSSASNATFDNYGSTLASYTGAVPAPGGRTEFFESASAGTATFNNLPGQGMGSLGAGVTIFHGNSTAAYGTFYNKGGQPGLQFGGSVEFYDTATAGNAYFYNEESPSQSDGSNYSGNVRFYGSSTAGNAKFYNQVGGGAVFFNESSTAGDGTFFIEDTATGTFNGHVVFNGNSKAGTSDITIKENCFSATVEFRGSANAEQAEIKLVDGSQGSVWVYNGSSLGQAKLDIGSSSNMLFRDSASAGNSTIRLRPGASATFSNSTTTAANATFNIDGATVSNGGTGGLFFDGGSAGDAIINVNAGTASGAAGGQLRFGFSTSAGNATINAGAGLAGAGGGRVSLSASTDATNARITIGANGALDLFGFGDAPVGSLDAEGSIFLGQTGLRIGGLNTSNTISGPIGGYSGNTNAKLTKVGTGTLTLTGANTYAGDTNVEAGSLVVNGSMASKIIVKSGATLLGGGSITGDVSINSGATLAPGTSPGTLTLRNLALAGGSQLNFELGDAARDHIVLTNSGNVSLGGTLNVSLAGSFTPTLGQSYPLFEGSIGSISGVFQSIVVPTINGLTFNLAQSASSTMLQVVNAPFLAGDYNGNGTVDAADYVAWRNAGTLLNDATPGVQPGDYDIWRANFGLTAGNGSVAGANATVPEPATLALLMIAAAGWYLLRRRVA